MRLGSRVDSFLLLAVLFGCGGEDGSSGEACTTNADCPGVQACKKFDESCQPLEQGRCEESVTECAYTVEPLACTCTGELVPNDCVPLRSDRITDAATCGGETFPCGDTTCAAVTELCVATTEMDGTTSYACASAGDRGCGEFGVADCECITIAGAGERCASDKPGQVTLSLSKIGPACEPSACEVGQACVDYITDMSTGTQCVALGECTECACAITQHCTSSATCEEVPGGLHLSNCFFGP